MQNGMQIKQVDPNALSENEVISIVESFQKSIKSKTDTRGEITENPIFAISEKYLISSRNFRNYPFVA